MRREVGAAATALAAGIPVVTQDDDYVEVSASPSSASEAVARALGRVSQPVRRVRRVLLLDVCGGCDGRGPAPCSGCLRSMRRAVVVPADRRGLDACRALLVYEGPARRLVAGLKYRNDRRVLSWLADGMSRLLDPPPGAVVTWVPTTPARRRQRGFDQAALLARAVARRWDAPCHDLLVRRSGTAQTGRTVTERQHGITFAVRPGRPLDTPVVLVDDVVTTGATLRSAAVVLRAAGTPWIAALTAATTPRRL